jgi:hypothetical protein
MRFSADFELANDVNPFPAMQFSLNTISDGTRCRQTWRWYQKSRSPLKVEGNAHPQFAPVQRLWSGERS